MLLVWSVVSPIPSLAIQSPRLVGEGALKLGQTQNILNKLPIKKTLRGARPVVSGIEESEEEARLNYLNSLLN